VKYVDEIEDSLTSGGSGEESAKHATAATSVADTNATSISIAGVNATAATSHAANSSHYYKSRHAVSEKSSEIKGTGDPLLLGHTITGHVTETVQEMLDDKGVHRNPLDARKEVNVTTGASAVHTDSIDSSAGDSGAAVNPSPIPSISETAQAVHSSKPVVGSKKNLMHHFHSRAKGAGHFNGHLAAVAAVKRQTHRFKHPEQAVMGDKKSSGIQSRDDVVDVKKLVQRAQDQSKTAQRKEHVLHPGAVTMMDSVDTTINKASILSQSNIIKKSTGIKMTSTVFKRTLKHRS